MYDVDYELSGKCGGSIGCFACLIGTCELGEKGT